jgi:hypothetical protein
MEDQEVVEALQRFVGQSIAKAFTAQVVDIDKAESEAVVTVEFDELTYDVKLKSIIDKKEEHLICIPRKGSQVFCVSEGNSKERFVVVACNEVDKVLFKSGKTSLQLSGDGWHLQADQTILKASTGGLILKKGDAGLKKTLESLIDAILKLTVTTPVGPSGTPINAQEFTTIKDDLNKYLTE